MFAAISLVVVAFFSYKWLVPWTIKRAAEQREKRLAAAAEDGAYTRKTQIKYAGGGHDTTDAEASKALLGGDGGGHSSSSYGSASKGPTFSNPSFTESSALSGGGGGGGGGSGESGGYDDEGMARGIVYDARLEDRFNSLNILTACFMAFSHGANDISNAAGPMIAVWDTYTKGRSNPLTSPDIPGTREAAREH